MTNAPALEGEIRKRREMRTILEEHLGEILRIFEVRDPAEAARPAARRPTVEDPASEARARIATLEELLSLRLQHVQTELELLRFLQASFGHYSVRGETISFDAQTNSDRYAELSQGIQDAWKALEAFQQRQQETLDAQKQQLEQPAP